MVKQPDPAPKLAAEGKLSRLERRWSEESRCWIYKEDTDWVVKIDYEEILQQEWDDFYRRRIQKWLDESSFFSTELWGDLCPGLAREPSKVSAMLVEVLDRHLLRLMSEFEEVECTVHRGDADMRKARVSKVTGWIRVATSVIVPNALRHGCVRGSASPSVWPLPGMG